MEPVKVFKNLIYIYISCSFRVYTNIVYGIIMSVRTVCFRFSRYQHIKEPVLFTQKDNRLNHIITLLQDDDSQTVNSLAEKLSVSAMTIRRDLQQLERDGIVKRIHGGASLLKRNVLYEKPYKISEQISAHAELKRSIGKAAAELVAPGEMIFLDSGSTTPYIAEHIDPGITLRVLCYTMKNALYFYERDLVQLILAGGFYERDSNTFNSREAVEMVRNLRGDKAFISAGGVDQSLGLTTYFYFETEMKKALISSAKQVILAADSSKFGKISTTFFAELNEVDTIITDSGIPEEYKEIIQQSGIELILADRNSHDADAGEDYEH